MSPLIWIIPIWAVAAFLAILRFGKRRTRGGGKGGKRMVALVLLLKRPRDLDEATLSAAVRRAFPNSEFAIRHIKGHLLVRLEGMALAVINFAGTYVADPGRSAEKITDFALKSALQDHTAWLSVDLVGPGDDQKALAVIGSLIAELATDDTLALYSAYSAQGIAWGPDLLPALRSDNPHTAFRLKRKDQVISAGEDNPQLAAAVAEARRRWPEFVQAFNSRRKAQLFSVKVPFPAGDRMEFMWVQVDQIDGKTIHGRLANEPHNVPNLKMHDQVTVTTDQLNDWLYIDGRNRFGGFTAAVLSRRR
jgi:uncharacterized protein YegJ (DUF2314 family)